MAISKQQKEARDAAMPDVKKLVKTHGRTVVGWCVNQLAEYERKVNKVKQARAELKKMEAELE